MLGLSYVYAVHGDVEWVDALFYGLGAAVVGIVAAAVIRIGKKALRNGVLYLVAAVLAFVAIFFFHVPFPLIVLGARADRPARRPSVARHVLDPDGARRRRSRLGDLGSRLGRSAHAREARSEHHRARRRSRRVVRALCWR